MPADYQVAVQKLVLSHAINELHGARHFDEPAIAFAPNPNAKALTCRVAMEEYAHHVRFYELGLEMGIPEASMLPELTEKRKLSMFDTPTSSWADFVTLKLFGDLAEVMHVEDLVHASFLPLQKLGRITMPEERFHTQFGEQYVRELCFSEAGRAEVQASLDKIFPALPACFGAKNSKNNAIFRAFGLKKRTNEEMRATYLERAGALAERFGLVLPAPRAAI
jgi:ring-1,2-phenylacetyl-CoA epoxidase subunit PaaA